MASNFSQDADKPIDQSLYTPVYLLYLVFICSRITYKVFLEYLILHIWEAELLVCLRNMPHGAHRGCSLVQRIYRQKIPPRYLLLIYYLLCYKLSYLTYFSKVLSMDQLEISLKCSSSIENTRTHTHAHAHTHRETGLYNKRV